MKDTKNKVPLSKKIGDKLERVGEKIKGVGDKLEHSKDDATKNKYQKTTK